MDAPLLKKKIQETQMKGPRNTTEQEYFWAKESFEIKSPFLGLVQTRLCRFQLLEKSMNNFYRAFNPFHVFNCRKRMDIVKMISSQFKGWYQLNTKRVLKFPHFFPASLQEKTADISMKLVPSFKVNLNFPLIYKDIGNTTLRSLISGNAHLFS